MTETTRMPIYDQIHKAIRRELFNMAILIGTTDFTDRAAADAFKIKFKQLLNLLEKHAEHEEKFIHPLLDRQTIKTVEAEHQQQEKELAGLINYVDLIDQASGAQRNNIGQDFYLAFNYFTANYLLHLDTEETMVASELRANYADEQILKAILAMIASFTPEEMVNSYEIILPAVNHPERLQMFTGLPKEAAERVGKIAESVLKQQQWQLLKNSLC